MSTYGLKDAKTTMCGECCCLVSACGLCAKRRECKVIQCIRCLAFSPERIKVIPIDNNRMEWNNDIPF